MSFSDNFWASKKSVRASRFWIVLARLASGLKSLMSRPALAVVKIQYTISKNCEGLSRTFSVCNHNSTTTCIGPDFHDFSWTFKDQFFSSGPNFQSPCRVPHSSSYFGHLPGMEDDKPCCFIVKYWQILVVLPKIWASRVIERPVIGNPAHGIPVPFLYHLISLSCTLT